ncbi:MAG: DoxX family protein [Candidatus Marinimicrobia bacterium]|nr:DoxX family protein [Candidatus Neomarinimicrobiota bacterium]
MYSIYHIFKSFSIFGMGIFYIIVGIHHFIDPEWYVQIVPPPLPFKSNLVYISGFFEILLGSLLFFKKKRFLAGWGLIILLIAVYPANIYLALTNGQAINTTPFIAWIRLPFQFVFIGLAYWHTKID